MIDFSNLEQYRENNRIEAKRALGGLPQSIWETYSAFANTLGGIILLGVEEHRDGSLHPIDLPDPQRLVREFWRLVNNPKRASVNILSRRHVQIQNIDGKHIISIQVPRAQRFDKPVYIDANPLTGSYRRSGEGDYRCTRAEVESMLRDAAARTLDMNVLPAMSAQVLDLSSVHHYRTQMEQLRPGHIWETLDDLEFLLHLGAVGRGRDGKLHPTGAGLLMFGSHRDIIKEFPHYLLDYQEWEEDSSPVSRLLSSSGDWSGNLFDFYTQVYPRIARGIRLPPLPGGETQGEDTPVHKALREALANCLVNADYYGQQGLVIVKRRGGITISNPGAFRIAVECAKSGGISDPRNGGLMKIFHLVNIGGGTGSGIPHIYSVWQKQGWVPPIIEERFHPERIILSLRMEKAGAVHRETDPYRRKTSVAEYLTDNISARREEIADFLGLDEAQAEQLLSEMVQDGTLVIQDRGQGPLYLLKS